MTAKPDEDREELISRMKSKWRHRIPVLDEEHRVIDLFILEEMLNATGQRENWVVLMAGGLGSRLGTLTESCPKPMLEIGGKPILETILTNFIAYGFKKFFISVNYRAEMIQNYFGNGEKWGVSIRYLHEKEKLGTAGALSLLPETPTLPVIVMNGDLLTKINFRQLIEFHVEQKSTATMGIREYDFQVPYGVVNVSKTSITSIDEKPVQKFFVNGGIYVLEPRALKHIPENLAFDMPSLFRSCLDLKEKVTAFPIREYWLDVGQIDDFEKATGEFPVNFTAKPR